MKEDRNRKVYRGSFSWTPSLLKGFVIQSLGFMLGFPFLTVRWSQFLNQDAVSWWEVWSVLVLTWFVFAMTTSVYRTMISLWEEWKENRELRRQLRQALKAHQLRKQGVVQINHHLKEK